MLANNIKNFTQFAQCNTAISLWRRLNEKHVPAMSGLCQTLWGLQKEQSVFDLSLDLQISTMVGTHQSVL